MVKPYAPACDENKAPILQVLQDVFTEPGTVLEIGSGTGQHGVHFARHLPHLVWQTSDVAEALPGIRAWRDEAALPNLPEPLELDLNRNTWPVEQTDYVFTANTAHIVAWPLVQAMFAGVGRVLVPGGGFCLYGPVNYGGRYTSASNAQFDRFLKLRDPDSGIRDFYDLNQLAFQAGLQLVRDQAMPVNNRTLIWRRREVG